MSVSNIMTAAERRASFGLAGIYGLRMLGLFIILPIFAVYSEHLPGGESHLLMGIALGAYGLTQAILQLPSGWLSDRYGRKPVIYGGLLVFALGSFIAASADNIYWVIAGRAIQGAGAINAAVMALTADLTREEVRTKAMAMIGMTIGFTFSLSLILSPVLDGLLGVPGIFALTGVLALLALLVVRFVIPDPAITRFHSDTEANKKRFGEVLRNKELLRLDFGIFAVHAILMSVFMQVPFLLQADNLEVAQHWKVYLPVMLAAFVLMLPFIVISEKKGKVKQVFLLSIALSAISLIMLLFMQHSVLGVTAALLVFFTAFNVLEAKLPALISIIAPLAARGTAMGVYSSVQFLGAFFGSLIGGALMQFVGGDAVFVFDAVLLLVWLAIAFGMQPPAPVRTKLYHLPEMDDAAAVELRQRLAQLSGVREVMVVATENMVCLKVDRHGFDETAVEQLVMKEHDMSVNKVILVGRLGDPETRYMTNGEAVTNATLATSENWKDKSGEKQEKTEWHNLVLHRRLAEIAGEYLKKGSQVYVEGKLQTRKWQTKEGQDRYTTEIIVNEMQMLGSKSGGGSFEVVENSKPAASSPGSAPAKASPAAKSSFDNFDDDIPF